jgi:hypothetical protein
MALCYGMDTSRSFLGGPATSSSGIIDDRLWQPHNIIKGCAEQFRNWKGARMLKPLR